MTLDDAIEQERKKLKCTDVNIRILRRWEINMKKETIFLKKSLKSDYEFLQHLLYTDFGLPTINSKYEYILSVCNDMTVKWNLHYNRSTTPAQKSICKRMFDIIDKTSNESLEIIYKEIEKS